MKIVDFNISGEDLHCDVTCDCTNDWDDVHTVGMKPDYIERCPHCGKGYRPELVVYQYEKDEKDERYSEWADLIKRLDSSEHKKIMAEFDEWMKQRETKNTSNG